MTRFDDFHQNQHGRRQQRRAKASHKVFSQSAAEPLEPRRMLTANVLDVTKVLWKGVATDAVRDEYVFRMPQLNASRAASPLDYQCNTPTVQAGWSLQTIGTGYFKLKAPGTSTTTVMSWAQRQGILTLDVNRVAKAARTPNDALYGDTNNWAFPKISAASAWDTGTGTDSTIVAVLDSGIDYRNPDLAANMWQNPNEIAGDGLDNDRNGYIDDIYGINALTGSSDPMDQFGHGTVVAGLIGAVGNNGIGLAGVNWTVRLMAVKVMDDGGNVPLSAELTGIQYILQQKLFGQNIAAVNCSFGRYSFLAQEFSALDQLAKTGVTIVAAAGNDQNNNDSRPFYPATHDIPGLISVAASDPTDSLAWFSNYGVTTVDLAAPGVDILSTRSTHPQVRAGLYSQYTGPAYTIADNETMLNEAAVDGTSCSAALVAGTAGLLKSLKIGASIQQIKDAILGGVDKSAGLAGRVATGGRLNVKNSVDLILATTGITPAASFRPGQLLTVVEGNDGYSYADVKITLDRPPDPGKSCSIWYETRPGGSAFPDIDYIPQSGYVTFSNSEIEKSFRIKIIGDRLPEADEQFAIRLDQTKSRGVLIATFQANMIIRDDDNTAGPSLPEPTNPLVPRARIDVARDASNVAVPMLEGGTGTFIVTLSRTSDKPITVKYRTNQPVQVPPLTALQGLDYTATSGSLTFRPGETTKQFTVPILADRVADDGERFDVLLFDPINAAVAGGNSNDGNSGAITATITDVPFSPTALPGFQITLSFPDSTLTTTQQLVFQQAANRWQDIIVGDLTNVRDPATGQVIDDILIVASAPTIDGAGSILGAAAPTNFRPGLNGLPWRAEMFFDAADVSQMEATGLLQNVILHEMGHALGLGSMWARAGLVQNAAGTDPIYVGANALREYRSIFGIPSAAGVPVENTGAQGTRGSHWRETVFRTEIMTGYAEPAGVRMPISRMTIGALQDLGYAVNYLRADAYAKPVALAAAPTTQAAPPPFLRGKPVSIAPQPVPPARTAVSTSKPAASPGVRSTASTLSASGSQLFAALAASQSVPAGLGTATGLKPSRLVKI